MMRAITAPIVVGSNDGERVCGTSMAMLPLNGVGS